MKCSIEDCNRKSRARNVCKLHYDRMMYNPIKKRESDRRHYVKHIDKIKLQTKIYRESHPEQKENIKRWHLEHPDRIKEIKNKYSSSDRGHKKHAAVQAKRRAKKLSATPYWANYEKISKFYENCPEGYHVDHIYPLQGKEVCGLHVLENLQYLPAIENIRKNNKFPMEL